MPPAGARYWELEAARTWGYRLSEWEAEDWLYRAEVVAHERERELRDAHLEDWKVTISKTQSGQGGGANPLEAQRAVWGIG